MKKTFSSEAPIASSCDLMLDRAVRPGGDTLASSPVVRTSLCITLRHSDVRREQLLNQITAQQAWTSTDRGPDPAIDEAHDADGAACSGRPEQDAGLHLSIG